MPKIYDGGPAYPYREEDGGGGYEQFRGMSLRDWFAGQALTGILAGQPSSNAIDWAPEHAYAMADAMLAARQQEGQK